VRLILVAAIAALGVPALAQDQPAEEISKGGSAVYHYGEPPTTALDADDYEIVDPDKIEAFLRPVLGESIRMHHELQSELVHLDVLFFPPKEGQPFWTLVTCGMSGRPMSLPDDIGDAGDFAYAELVMSLPEEWIPKDANGEYDFDFFERDGGDWPVDELMYLARLPHLQRTWLAAGHSITNDDPPRPIVPDTRMDGFVLGRPMTWLSLFHQMKTDGDKRVNFLAVFPVFPEEMKFKLDVGSEALFTRFRENGVTEVLRPGRDSVIDATLE
jgi:hypothetical protein